MRMVENLQESIEFSNVTDLSGTTDLTDRSEILKWPLPVNSRGTAGVPKTAGHFKLPRVRASFTVEAAFLMPIVVLLLVWTINLSIGLYQQVDTAAQEYTEAEEYQAVQRFRKLSGISSAAEAIEP